MNSKLMKASLAGAAAIALAAGGGTFAAWSDFAEVTDNNVGAGTLTLSLPANGGSDFTFDQVKMAPGGINSERNVYVATNDGTSTPNGKLFLTFKNVKGTEDGCDGNGELADDANCDDGLSTNEGEFIDDALVQVTSYSTNTPGVCNQSYSPGGHTVTALHGGSLTWWKGQPAYELTGNGAAYGGPDMTVLHPGEGLCVSVSIGLAHAVDNASQGDSADFDMHFDLVQP
jgi:predicted ribosomally synthesized peptide with SipW-like signal peptide